MIYFNQGENNTVVATCSRNKQLSTPTYLWSMRHKLTNETYRFIPYQIPTAVNYSPSYDQFTIKVDYNEAVKYTATTANDTANLHFTAGEYYIKIYEQQSTTNLNPSLSYDVVYETIGKVIGTGTTASSISYTATTEVFKVYKG